MYGGAGAAFYTSFVRDSYINLKPKTTGVVTASGSSTLALAIAAAAFVVVVVVVLVLVRRRRGLAEEE
jgi:flagellar biosynthesis/type III secretory pathway M-ring protein FliF/YscJ